MFTDIVDSTTRAAELGDRRWRDLVEEHDRLVRARLERYRGREVKTLGDGFLATFDGPGRAIRCAADLRDGVRRLGLEVRAGLHTGECEVAGDDIRGIAVNIGARVGATAAAGEVLVSQTVKDLVAGSGLDFEDRGEHELKGVPGSWRLYSVGGRMILAIDQGTSGTTCLVFDEDGQVERPRLPRVHAALPAPGLGRARRRRDLGRHARRGEATRSTRPASTAARWPASASPTSARRSWPGTATPASRCTARSSGRTGAPPPAATSCATPATSRSCASAPGWCSTPTSPARRSSG